MKGFFALALANEVQNLRRIGQRVLNLLCKIGVAILTDRDVVDIGHLHTGSVQTGFDSKRRKSRVVLDPVQALFRDGEDNFSILYQGSGSVCVKHVETENQHK